MRKTHKPAPRGKMNTNKAPASIADALRLMKSVVGQPAERVSAFVTSTFGPKMKIRWEADGASVVRLMFSPDRAATDLQIYHGLVLDVNMQILSMGARSLAPRETTRGLSDDYVAYDAVDGTQVTLYWFEGSWRLSTLNGYDVGDYQWLGEKTYWEAFADRASCAGLDINTLEHDASYTFVFRDGQFHPLPTDPESLWFICAHDIKALNDGTEPRELAVPGVSVQVVADISTVMSRCTGALDAYMNACKGACGESATLNSPPTYYGAILRSKSGANPDYMIESTLLKRIRKLMYTLPHQQRRFVGEITPANRVAYLTLRAYLSPARGDFIVLFPQYAETMANYGKMFQALAGQIVTNLRDRQPTPAVTPSERLAEQLAAHLREHTQLNAMDATGPSIVYDFLMQPEHTDMFYATLIYTAVA